MSEKEMAQTFTEIINLFLNLEIQHLFRPRSN